MSELGDFGAWFVTGSRHGYGVLRWPPTSMRCTFPGAEPEISRGLFNDQS